MTDILMTHSYFLRFDPKQEQAHMPYPPLGMLYAASYLRKACFSLAHIDTMFMATEEELRLAFQNNKPRILVIYDDDFNYLNKMCLSKMREAAFRMSAMAKEYHIPVVIHGSDAVDHVGEYLQHGADVIIVGEGEETLLQVCQSILNGHPTELSGIEGIAYRSNDQVIHTAKRRVNQQLDTLPFPAWDLVDWKSYRSIWIKHHGYFSVNMVTTRGCPYHCNWCAKPIYGQVYNSRSPENVAEEMVFLTSLVSPDHLWFADDIFGLKPGWVQQFAEIVKSRNIMIPFKIQSRADLLLRENTVEALASAGCAEVWIGAESGSQKILDAMEKGITVNQIKEARRLLRKFNIKASFFLQFGYRGETMEDIQKTISLMKELMPDNIGISVSYPLPGTKFYDIVQSEMVGKRNWTDSDDLSMMYHGTYSSQFYKRLHRYVHKVFRSRQGLLYLRNIFEEPFSISQERLRRILLLLYYWPALVIDKVILTRLSK